MQSKLLQIITVLFVCINTLFAQNSHNEKFEFTLKQCIDYALSNQFNVLSGEIEAAKAEQQVRELLALGYPQIGGQADLQHYLIIPTQVVQINSFVNPMIQTIGQQLSQSTQNLPEQFRPAPLQTVDEPVYSNLQFGTKNNFTAGLQLSQLVADGTFFIGLKAANSYVELSRKAIGRNRIETVSAVSKAFYSVIINEKRVKLIANTLSSTEQILDKTKQLKENGFAEQLDVDRIEVALNNLRTDIEKAKRMVEISRYFLKYQMGMEMTTHLILKDQTSEKDFSRSEIDTLAPFLPEDRLEYRLLEHKIVVQNYNIKRLKVAYLPTINAYANFNVQALRNEFNFFDTKQRWFPNSIIGVRLNVPIFDGFKKDAMIQTAKLDQVKNHLELDNARMGFELEFFKAKTDLSNSLKTIDIQKRNFDLAKRVFDVTQEKLKHGEGSNIEVLNAERELTLAQANYVNAMLDAYNAKIDFLKATGKLAD